jgi:hypothetical protein
LNRKIKVAQKFQQYIDEPDNPKWKKIAAMGRKHALQEFNNEKASRIISEINEGSFN